jgi:Protein of unknown function (DUF3352)
MPSKMPDRKSKFVRTSVKYKQRRRIVVGAGAATLVAAAATIGIWKLFPSSSGNLDTSNGVSLLPQDTLLSIAIATDAERWQKLTEFGVPESRGVFEQKLAKFQTDFLTDYGYDYDRDIQPWIGKQILIGYLDNATAITDKSGSRKIPYQQAIAILPIADRGAASRVLEQHQTPTDANLVQTNYKGVDIREIKRKAGTIAVAILDNYVAIASDRSALQRVIDTQQNGKSLLTVPGYTKALKEIEIDRPFAQVYMNIPVATAFAAVRSPETLAADKLAQAQIQQGIAANATLDTEGIAWKGISWLKPTTKQKLAVENQGRDFATNLPANTLIMVSGGNLQRLWQDYTRSAENNPIAPFKPQDLVKNLDNLTGLDLNSEILPWSKGAFGIAIIPKPEKVDTELGTGLAILQQVNDRSAADKAFTRLDARMNQPQIFKVEKAKLNGKDVVNWSSPLGLTAATRGWLDNNLAFLTLGAPVASSVISPEQKLADNKLFQQSTRSSLTPHNGQFFIDIDRSINAGNLPLPAVSPEVIAVFKAVRSLGVTSAILDESSNRFDMFVALKKVPGVAKLPTPAKSPKAIKPSPNPAKSPSPTPTASP